MVLFSLANDGISVLEIRKVSEHVLRKNTGAFFRSVAPVLDVKCE